MNPSSVEWGVMTLHLQCSQEKKRERKDEKNGEKNGLVQNQTACSGPVPGWDGEAAAIGVFQPSILAGGIPKPASPLLWRMFR